ncbi:hypothetical protein TSUD_356290 [Trifolium subterraneum]|uniref:F-box/LRR-repeat protein 15/At3g58940/PEG3-like LRR domain-containing protein n=1 Tax=Trifolium subterraneum TaxID=3900 RepID=A0A2Z6M4L8_TRISU|nr:hypothetical protein TSUD_356290 [Trifolium subterraneum]
MEQEEDRLSSLPKIILYDILSRLPEKDATRQSVLSKVWLDTWNTFPILSFCVTQIIGRPPQPTEKILRFCDYVTRRMLRFRNQSLTIKKFKLNLDVNHFGVGHMSKDIDIWLKLACESGIEVIEYVFLGRQPYVLPMCVIEAKSLTKLVLVGLIKIQATFLKYSIKFSSLRELSMSCVCFGDGQMFEHLISFCPSIEYISLYHCTVLSPFQPIKALSMSGLQKLKAVDVSGIHDIFIDSPSLEKLVYIYSSDSNTPPKIDFDKCRNLKELYLENVTSFILTDKWFLDLFSKFPFLESLKLKSCQLSEKIDISSFRLKVLELLTCYLKEVNIDAPNLLLCKCDLSTAGDFKPIISFLRTSNQLEVKIMIRIHFVDLCNLREFVQNIKPHGVLTSLSLVIMDPWHPIELKVTSPPPSIKNLDLHYVPANESLFSSLVNIILLSCCPSTISFSLQCNRAFIEFFYERLMRRKDNDCFCSSSDTKCWWHDLKDVKVTNSMKINENVDLKTMLDSFPTEAEGKISLMLEF